MRKVVVQGQDVMTLPASNTYKPLRSVTDILRELKALQKDAPPSLPTAPAPLRKELSARFGSGEVTYTPSVAQAKAVAFASALDNANVPSQPSPPSQTAALPLPSDTTGGKIPHDDDALATSHLPTNQND
ncbi:hypothetical protein AX14_008819 [Amanita brunnescens Koide BX004]|nr:hypothetical protein AX14_008819 [Amanita brunnescens Koide BX004]